MSKTGNKLHCKVSIKPIFLNPLWHIDFPASQILEEFYFLATPPSALHLVETSTPTSERPKNKLVFKYGKFLRHLKTPFHSKTILSTVLDKSIPCQPSIKFNEKPLAVLLPWNFKSAHLLGS